MKEIIKKAIRNRKIVVERPDLQPLIEQLQHCKANKKLIEKEMSILEENLKSSLNITKK